VNFGRRQASPQLHDQSIGVDNENRRDDQQELAARQPEYCEHHRHDVDEEESASAALEVEVYEDQARDGAQHLHNREARISKTLVKTCYEHREKGGDEKQN